MAPRRKETEIGIAIHKLAKLLLDTSGEISIPLSKDDWVIPPAYFINLQQFIVKEVPKLKSLVGPDSMLFPETQIRLDEDWTPTFGWPNGFIVGALDLAIYDPNTKTCVIVDYKTGNTSEEDLIKYYKPQLELYSLLFHLGHAPVEKIGLIIRAGHSSQSLWLTDGLEDFDLSLPMGALRENITKAHENLKVITPTPHFMCKYCAFRIMCTSYKEDE